MKRITVPTLEFRFPTQALIPHYEDNVTVLRIPEGTPKAQADAARALQHKMAKGKQAKTPSYRANWRKR